MFIYSWFLFKKQTGLDVNKIFLPNLSLFYTPCLKSGGYIVIGVSVRPSVLPLHLGVPIS